ncbi:carbohydrate-binding module family 20 domain-containing protein [Couchioplanes azureus]|uniref:carbohydrate-binding module family 20 domain-containing protein n=1 Tax=Couchioplanes caeruleus TaxID=56438 RepID=UPI00166FDA1B|nr:carbohydrate-binding module family 20 domain-containing protein [Couchioplanes caeruleus]GGQ58878.1 alpha-amylase [Couchioplanes caeruleus subsp. azureus]
MRIRPVLAAVTVLLAAALAAACSGRERAEASMEPSGARDVIVHLFAWPWASVAGECTRVLGPKGYGGVQVSPPQEHVVLPGKGYPWWQDYQPVSYRLTSRRGDREAFAAMVRACHAAGVKVYADAVVNHMAGGASTGPGSGGSAYSQYAYPAVPYGDGDFHHCGRNGTDDIADWGDRWEIQNCELVDLSDLRTESPYVRGKLVAYLDDLVSLGVDGFRVDAAKHLSAADLAAVVDAVRGDPYVYSEVIEGGAGEPGPEEYTGIGAVTEFRYGDVVGGAFRDGKLSGLRDLATRMRVGSGDAVAFVDNHDTQRTGRASLTYRDGAPYALAEAFMIAWPYGVPQVMSSFTFGDPEAGPPTAGDGTTTAVSCGDGWQCEHRWRTTANMVALRTTAAGAPVTHWWSNGTDQIAFGRGGAAYVAFNRSGAALTRTFQTSLPAGGYCDVMAGDFSAGTCTGPAYTVDASGRVTATVPAGAALALHAGARVGPATPVPACASAPVTFAVTVTTTWGQNVFVTGDTAGIGGWNPAAAVPLSAAAYPVWRATVTLPGATTVQYKYLEKEGSTVVRESGANRVRTTAAAGPCGATWQDTWR